MPPDRPESSLRSFLFSPGSDERKLQKAAASDADAVILDLEDAVAEARKAEARELVAACVKQHGAARPVYVRVNSVPSGHIADDLAAICSPELAGIWLPMAEKAEEVWHVDALLAGIEAERGMKPGAVGLVLSFETARGVHHAFELASAAKRVTGVSAGTAEGGDLHAEMGGLWSDETGIVPHVRLNIAIAARAAGISCLVDGACTRLDDQVVSTSAKAARDAGYSAKSAIHPGHISLIHAAFAPLPEEVAHAKAVIVAFAQAEAEGIAAIKVDGRMIDYAMVVNARRVLEQAGEEMTGEVDNG